MSEDTKRSNKNRNSKKDRQYNDEKIKVKKTNDGLQNTRHKSKD